MLLESPILSDHPQKDYLEDIKSAINKVDLENCIDSKKDDIFNNIKCIEPNTIIDLHYVSLCFEAMKQIYAYNICDYKKGNYDIDCNNSIIYERNYVIELAVILAQKQERLDTTGLKGKINGEVAKKLSLAYSSITELYIEIRKKIDKHYKGKKKELFVLPDFLIHESHSYENGKLDEKYQHLAMEVKTKEIKRKELFFLDFLKLNYYLDTLHYANVVYMLVGTSIDSIDQYIGSYLNEVKYISTKAKEQLVFFIQERLDLEPVIYKLK